MLVMFCVQGSKKSFSWTNLGSVASENGHALIFFRHARKKIHLTKSPHIKDLLANKLQLVESDII